MNLAETWRIILKRWYVLLPMLLLAAVLTAGVDKSIAVKYQSTAMISLLASSQATKGTSTLPGTGNPFLSFDSSLNDTADFLSRRVNSATDAQQLAGEGVTGTYSEALAASQGPFIMLTVTGADSASTEAEMNTLITYTGQQLQALQVQESVPTADQIRSAVIVPGSIPQAQTKSKLQDTLGAAIGGIAIALLVTLAMNTVLGGRRRGGRPGRSARGGASARPSLHELDPEAVAAQFDAFTDSHKLLDQEHADLLSRLPDARD